MGSRLSQHLGPASRSLGVVQILLSGACFGFLGYFGKTAYARGIEPLELLALRFFVAGLAMAVWLVVRGEKPWRLGARKIAVSCGLGVFGYAVFSSCYFLALQGISASLTVLLLYTYPVLVSVGAASFFGERLGRRGSLALVISLVGLVGLVWGEWQLSRPLYLVFGLGAAFFYAVYILVSRRRLEGVPAEHSTLFILLGAGVALFFVAFDGPARPLRILADEPGLILGVAGLCSVVAMTLFQAGLQKLSAPETSILSTSEPLFGVLVASWLLGERLQPLQWAGGALVLLAMTMLATRRKAR